MTLREQLLDLGKELVARLSSQEHSVANARAATTELSRARVERNAVELFLEERAADAEAAEAEVVELERTADPRASGG